MVGAGAHACAGVFALLMPMMFGVLQGRQNFLWLGWALLSLGVLRVAAMASLIRLHEASAINGMIAVGLGYVLAFGIALNTANLPRLEPAEWMASVMRGLARSGQRFLPLSIGGGTVIFMMRWTWWWCSDISTKNKPAFTRLPA